MIMNATQRVLDVEDKQRIAEFIGSMLEGLPCQVTATASSLDEAVALARTIESDLAIPMSVSRDS